VRNSGGVLHSGLLAPPRGAGREDVHGRHRGVGTVGRGVLPDGGRDVSEQEPGPPRTPADLAAFIQTATERLMAGWTTATGGPSGTGAGRAGPPLPGTPALPATLSTRQLQALLDDLAARRAQVQALATQLEAFDGQLASFEASLRPVLDWVGSLADLEKSVAGFWRPPGGASSAPGER